MLLLILMLMPPFSLRLRFHYALMLPLPKIFFAAHFFASFSLMLAADAATFLSFSPSLCFSSLFFSSYFFRLMIIDAAMLLSALMRCLPLPLGCRFMFARCSCLLLLFFAFRSGADMPDLRA